ncbi:DEAD/DEAH box helicase [Mycoplasmopsis pullorum]|uniref:type I restriction endonuclease subunit R n=1 Tax=Mycoplasmopsis pullorum TaxID=48003 RepID=UPI00111B2ED2|nr:type I restriction endonuclease subunit R [Mycoplasmopsis pullorum]TNK82090.1 DEAD/DEAH box helicase [Mycoplasmopsis pullorum]TNK83290.1 DEAD/DEAH box helicase [Mycoplasmopsis pullorum]TNK84388.1 DEAD/DEAH box helicase [Mycoplasmopsis pullorum]TNK86852.1 DEAD/DEAH box helicase [Mycoplasmopsis pullorum]TNK88573.1 DEAD/DEAH box helicase [Mycoplasmopsis pullorum]
MQNYKQIMERNNDTVVADISLIRNKKRDQKYQSEAELEQSFINILKSQGYEYLSIDNEEALIQNLRVQIERLNNYKFQSEQEWNRFFNEISSSKKGIEDKTEIIQQIRTFSIKLDNGTSKNIKVIDAKHIHDNRLQVINQYQANNGTYKNRYDVTILVNGLPLVHLELKRRGSNLKEAFNQIQRYQRESFWSESGLFEFIQVFVISNGTDTKYYSNTTRELAKKASSTNQLENEKILRKNIQSFEFTSYWTDEKNNKIHDLIDFAQTFFTKTTILNILTKYCVFDSNKMLLVMRPYQITATEKIIKKIITSKYEKSEGTIQAGGYIWHTTGSGKTLTSFKTAELIQKIPEIDKILFVVDRRDLDYQTIREYKRFSNEFAAGVKNTKDLAQLLNSDVYDAEDKKVIVVTIQKLSNFIKQYNSAKIYNQNIVFVFDECHRSQFGAMHKAITKKFKKYHLFGFTGTPIFSQNSIFFDHANNALTTEDLFGQRLHTYTIVNAIDDGNVLPFKVDYVNTIKLKDVVTDKKVTNIDTYEVRISNKRISAIVEYILEHYDQKTKTHEKYVFDRLINTNELTKNPKANENKKSSILRGFNSIFAVENIEFAKKYYLEFQKQIKAKDKKLKVATIFTYAPNKEIQQFGEFDDEDFTKFVNLQKSDRDFLQEAINDYNYMFNTSYSIDREDGFQNYYKNVSLKMKNREIDILIVVNMFLTGFDSTTLNTLWVDRPMRQHGLVQAFSRTNRILNSIKSYGNIVTFRDISKETNEAIALFGDKNTKEIVLLKTYSDYIEGYTDKITNKKIEGYKELTTKLKEKFPIDDPQKLDEVLLTKENKKEFISLFGSVLRLRNILKSFDQFQEDEETFLDKRSLQDYSSRQWVISEENEKAIRDGKESIIDDVVIELELVRQDEINIDYILKIVSSDILKKKNTKDIQHNIESSIDSSSSLRNKKELIFKFIEKMNVENSSLHEQNSEEAENRINDNWNKYTEEEYNKELTNIIEEMNLYKNETQNYMSDSFANGEIRFEGPGLGKTIKENYFNKNRNPKRKKVYDKLKQLFDKFRGLVFPE